MSMDDPRIRKYGDDYLERQSNYVQAYNQQVLNDMPSYNGSFSSINYIEQDSSYNQMLSANINEKQLLMCNSGIL